MKILYATRAVFGPCEIRHRDGTTTTHLCWHNDYKIKFADAPLPPDLMSEIREERAAIRQAESYRKARRRILRELRARKDADAIARANAFFRRTDELPALIRAMSEAYNTQSV